MIDSSKEGTCTAENSIALSLRLSKSNHNDVEDLWEDKKNCNKEDSASCGSEKDGSSCCAGEEGSCSSSKSPVPALCYSCRWMLSEIVRE